MEATFLQSQRNSRKFNHFTESDSIQPCWPEPHRLLMPFLSILFGPVLCLSTLRTQSANHQSYVSTGTRYGIGQVIRQFSFNLC